MIIDDVEEPAVCEPGLQPVVPVACEEGLLRILATTTAGFHRKERELIAWFGRLSLAKARRLHRRLVVPALDDALAAALGRMMVERRQRIGFLADAPRRHARRGRI